MLWPKRAAAALAALALSGSLLIFPRVAPLFPARELARQCEPWLQPDMELATLDYTEPSLVWYFRAHIRGFMQPVTAAELPEFMAAPGARVCILPTSAVGTIFPELSDWDRVDVKGFNLAKGKPVELTALVKQTPAMLGE